ncbi:MAG: nucleotide exchange factor GrpE [Eubacterium sp.]|nr:nucleotide exchange factor GrpE [Eubacterium sp.]
MRTVIGVHFWERQARLCVCDADSVSVAAIDLPSDIKRLNIVATDFALVKAFEVIDNFINEHMNVEEYALVMCVSDDTGLKEIESMYKTAEQCGVTVIRTMTETMAMAYFSYVEYELVGPVMIAFASPAKLAVAGYYMDEGEVELEDTFIAGRWNSSTLKNEFLTPASKRFFDNTEAPIVVCAGTMDRCLEFDQALKSYINSTNLFVNTNIEYKMIDPQSVIEGIGFLCGKLEGRQAFQGLKALDTLSAYELCVSINGSMFPIVDMDSLLPVEEEIEIEKYPEAPKSFDEIIFFEKRGRAFVEVCNIKMPRDQMEFFYRKPCKLTVSADANRRLKLGIRTSLGDKDIKIDVLQSMSTEEVEQPKEESVADFLAKMLPIIDDLEYAIKFAADEDNPYTQGIMKTYNKAIQILESNGVTIITGEGEPFDYNTQTAVAHVSDLNLPDNTVKQVMQAGYMYKGKVIRPASVMVAN